MRGFNATAGCGGVWSDLYEGCAGGGQPAYSSHLSGKVGVDSMSGLIYFSECRWNSGNKIVPSQARNLFKVDSAEVQCQ